MGFIHNPHGEEAVRISIGFTVAGNLIVLLRLYCRIFLVRLIGTEDWCITVGMLCSTAFTILVKVQADAGLGVHEWELTKEELLKPLKAFYASLIFYNMTLAFVKASFLFQYNRLFVENRTRMAIYIVGAIILLFSIEAVVVSVFMCVPIKKFWVPSLPGFCVDKRPLWFTNSSLHIVTDIAIFIIPMPELSRLKLPRGQKIALILVFACGFFACVTSIIRLHTLIEVSSGKDLTHDNATTATWSVGELNISLICACLPVLRPLFAHLVPQLLHISTRSRSEGPIELSRQSRRIETTKQRTSHSELKSTGDYDKNQAGRMASDDQLPLSTCWPPKRSMEGDEGSVNDNVGIKVRRGGDQRNPLNLSLQLSELTA